MFRQYGLDEKIISEALNKTDLTIWLEDDMKVVIDMMEGGRDSLSTIDDVHQIKTTTALVRNYLNSRDIKNLSTVTNYSHDTTNDTANISNQQYLSMSDSTTEEASRDETIYHSMLETSKVSKKDPLDAKETLFKNLQSIPIVAYNRVRVEEIIKEFDKDPLRAAVKARANEVPIMTGYKMKALKQLSSMFTGGVTIERIVILFYFFADIAIRAVELKKREVAVDVLKESFEYITLEVDWKIWEGGGWLNLLSDQKLTTFKIFVNPWIIAFFIGIGLVTLFTLYK